MLKTIFYATKQKVRVAQFSLSKGSCKLLKEKILKVEGGAFSPALLKIIMHKERLTGAAYVSCLFRYQVGLRFFLFPSRDPQEISRMVEYEAAEILPLKTEETTTRWRILNTQKSGYSQALVIVAHNEEISRVVTRYQEAGLEIDTLTLSSLAIFNSAKKVFAEKKKGAMTSNVMVIYIEDEIVEIIVIKKGVLEFSRGFLIHDPKNLSQVLVSEIRHSIDVFFNESKERHLERILISTHGVDINEVVDKLEGLFDIPVAVEKNINLACGLALTEMKDMNLLSNDFIAAKAFKKMKKSLLVTVLLFFLNIALLAGVCAVVFNNKKVYLDELQKQVTQSKPQAQAIQNKLIKLQMVRKQLSSQTLILDALSDLVNVMPASVNLNTLSLNEEGVLVVRGQSKTLQDVLDFVAAIEKSAYFKNSRLNYSSRRKIKEEERIDFEIQARLNEAALETM
ncbi:MAG: PilN domain-containing protein [Candidatus Omnitrophica bacterium]|nr:PilN domain-containing protein [Candidatus Omnitrophota bacterium]MBU4477489.1 PilN domain-containing protein [Candidatus Omnitrophota bacterium]MCG2703729.1 PilN domain-containing protein [Candidatus Omnitrophota bacterium]